MIRYANLAVRFAADLLDFRKCRHHNRPVNCDCDTIQAELDMQD